MPFAPVHHDPNSYEGGLPLRRWLLEFRYRFRDVDILVVDDIHYLGKRDRTQEEFFHTFNALQTARTQIVLSSDARPEDIPHLEERLVSRFKWGVVTPSEKPGFETRLEIVRQKSALHSYQISDEVAEFISSCRENQTLSTLMKALNIEALSGDDMAGRVLAHLGFTEAV